MKLEFKVGGGEVLAFEIREGVFTGGEGERGGVRREEEEEEKEGEEREDGGGGR
jgi:hypothetical protein